MYKAYIAFEKKRGDRAGIIDIVITGQRPEYEKQVTADPTNYNAWFEYAKMDEENQTARCEGATSMPLPTSSSRWRTSNTGGGTSTFGSTMPCTMKCNSVLLIAPPKYMVPASI